MGVNDFLAFIDLLVLAIFLFSVFRLLKRDCLSALLTSSPSLTLLLALSLPLRLLRFSPESLALPSSLCFSGGVRERPLPQLWRL